MLQYISNFRYNTQNRLNSNFDIKYLQGRMSSSNLKPLQYDLVSFTGMSAPSHYKSVFDYLAADILSKNKKFQVDGSMLSSSNIQKAMEKLFNLNKVYGPYTESLPEKIKWKSYIPEEVRVFSTDKINEARASRLQQWQRFLESPEYEKSAINYPELVSEINNNKSLKFIIWNAINSEIKHNNRHIPVPFNAKALYQTIVGFEKIEPIDRAVRCSSPSFIECYTHRLRDNLLESKGLSDNNSVWVKIPSIKNDLHNKERNISSLEILSCRNWCTRSSVDKAEAALQDGDFYIYLERDKNRQWKPLIAMASSRGKIDQIQGIENNNIIPVNQLDNVKEFIKISKIKCNSDIISEGPKALQQIYISEKLAQFDGTLGKTLDKAIREKDDFSILSFLNKKVSIADDNSYIIGTYKPFYNANQNSGISIPYSMMGIDEDIMLQNVRRIDGDLMLDNKNKLFSSSITVFPPKLETVTGKVVCSKQQYEMFGEDILRVIGNNSNKVIIR